MNVPESHIHSLERCEHEVIGEEVHWLCGMHPVWTNVATAWAVHEVSLGEAMVRALFAIDDAECLHLSATGVDQTWGGRKVWRCDACGWAFMQVTVDGITRMLPAGWPQRIVEVDR